MYPQRFCSALLSSVTCLLSQFLHLQDVVLFKILFPEHAVNALTGLGRSQISQWFYAKPWDTSLTVHPAAREASHPREGAGRAAWTVLLWWEGAAAAPAAQSLLSTFAQHRLCTEGRSLTELQLQTCLSHKLYRHPEKSLAASFPPTCPPGQLCWKIPSSLPHSTEQGFDGSWKKMF